MPFCPKCKSEYREGFTLCSDCKVPLVESLDNPKLNEAPDESIFMSFDEYRKFAAEDSMDASDDEISSSGISDDILSGPTPEEAEQIRLEMLRRRMSEERETEFVSKKDKAGEYLSSGIMLIVMGVLGCVFIGLLVGGVLPFKVHGIVSYIIDAIMFLFFGMFIYFGINSLVRYKEVKREATVENKENDEFEEWFKKTITKEFIDSDLEITDDEQTNFFKRNAKIKYLISQNYPSVSDGLSDLYIDKYYGDIFE